MSFSKDEIMTVATSRYIADGDTVFIGTGLPMVAAYLAKATHAPNVALMFESGVLDPRPRSIAKAVGDPRLVSTARRVSGMMDSLLMLQGGRVDLGVLGCAQVDRFGNINTTAIGSYERPSTRLPGSGGANDIASCAKHHLIVTRHNRRTFVESVDYLTTPGHLTGPGARQRAGLPGGGPIGVVTDLGVFGFDARTCEMVVESVHPGVSLDDVRAATAFELAVKPDLSETKPPSDSELDILRTRIDPEGVYL
ncbi:CoA-transferase subunit beta [Asanoa iriomotensis]|uniref:3-oxoadipate--succinyl-CoA transferase subunit B n=1 Tax=Asanoa iriomotensis TaxID=234613 RepID=A0ABQ4BYX3_9ACTN|nr:CoA-transferase [Asanoa iriomotensis]GIF55730.1 3-oxoadipate--succinyl-CoA transferase subunit B [Asanoa iriomotensis]